MSGSVTPRASRAPGRRAATIVLGMHRSGTSALTGLLGERGLTLPNDPLPPHPDNPKGYGKSRSVVMANEDILRSAGTTWFDIQPPSLLTGDQAQAAKDGLWAALDTAFGDADHFVLKDPRMCRLMPLWLEALTEKSIDCNVVMLIRRPVETAQSLASRDAMTLAYAGALWLRNNSPAERATRKMRRTVVRYDDLVSNPDVTQGELVSFLGLAEGQTSGFVDPALKRQVASPKAPDAFFAHLDQVYERLGELGAHDDADAHARLDGLVASVDTQWFSSDIIAREELISRWEIGETRQRRVTKLEARLRKLKRQTSTAGATSAPAAVIAQVRDSGLFDEAWYLARYPEARAAGGDPIDHYLTVGAALGLDPSPTFNTRFYAAQMRAAETDAYQGRTPGEEKAGDARGD